MSDGTMSLADIAAIGSGGMTHGGGLLAGGVGLVTGLILASVFGGGLFGNRNSIGYENLATSNEVQRGFDNQNSMANEREILGTVNAGTAQAVAATNQTFHDLLGALDNRYNEVTRDIGSLQVAQAQALANQNQCCCETKLLLTEQNALTNANIAQNRYDAAMNTAAINANTAAQTQKILDAITGNRIADMQNQINQLSLANQMLGVVKYPMSTAYTSGGNPFCNCGCGC